ncbi:MAG TPA: transcriptional repressor [Haloplasmataceae bacterium]
MKTLLTQSGLKKTKPRLMVLNVLKKAKEPLTVEEIYQDCHKKYPTLNLSTVYRILDTFLEKGIVLKPLIKDNTTSCYILNKHKHTHYIICQECHKMIDIEFCPFADYEKEIAKLTNFTILNHKLEFSGICPTCKKRMENK